MANQVPHTLYTPYDKDTIIEQAMTIKTRKNPSDEDMLPKVVFPQADDWEFKISYWTTAIFIYFHLSAIYGLYLGFTCVHWATIILDLVLLEASILGILAGAHRLWAHRSYKATLPLQIILMVFQSMANQHTALNWARDHRLHHRHSDTDADPHNATRGFFFSHVGWLLVHKHPEVYRRGASTELSDLLTNPVLVFQKKYKVPIIFFFAFAVPTIIPMYFWNETFDNAYHANILRIILCLNFISLINSLAHASGTRPYDTKIRPTENIAVQLATLGEGSHNYHHVFPWDYRAAELVTKLNLTAAFIEFFARIGWAYDLKTVEQGKVVLKARKCGDGSYQKSDATKNLRHNSTLCMQS